MSIYKKIYDIMCETKALPKDMSVAGQYKAISEAVVLNEMKPLLKKYSLVLLPTGVTAKQEGKLTVLETEWLMVDVDTGESVKLMAPGNGADPQDKGSGKAWTYAYKAVLQKTFMLFSGEDTDNTHSDEVSKAIDKDQKKLSTLVDLFDDLPKQTQDKTLAHYKIKDIAELPVDLWDRAIKGMTK